MEGILNIYGADFFGVTPGSYLSGPGSGSMAPAIAAAIAVVHLAGVALALWGVCRAFRRFFSAELDAADVMGNDAGKHADQRRFASAISTD